MEDDWKARTGAGEAKSGLSVSQRLEVLRTKREGPRPGGRGNIPDEPKQGGTQQFLDDRSTGGGGKPGPEDEAELSRMRSRLAATRQNFRNSQGGDRTRNSTARLRSQSMAEDDDDDDEEEGSMAMVYLPKPKKPFGEIGIIQPIHPTASQLVAVEGTTPMDNPRVLFFPQGSWKDQVVEAVGRTVEAWRRRPWGAWLSGGANRAEGGGIVQTGQDDEEWLLQEDGLYVDDDRVVLSRFASRHRLLSRLQRDLQLQRLETKQRQAWDSLSKRSQRNMLLAGVVEQEDEDEDDDEEVKEEGGEEGPTEESVSAAHNPVQDTLSRPLCVSMEDGGRSKPVPTHLQLQVVRTLEQGSGPGGEPSSCMQHEAALHLAVSRVTLYDHPLFTHEDELYAQLRQLFAHYRRHLEENSAPHLTSRLSALCGEIQHLRALYTAAQEGQEGTPKGESGVEGVERLEVCRQLFDDAMESVLQLLMGEQGFRKLASAFYSKWKDLERERERTGFNCTPARVVAYEVERPPPPAASVSSMEGVLTELAQGMGWLASQISGQWERNHAGYAPLMNELEIGKYNEVDWAAEAVRAQEVLEACKQIFPRDDQPDFILKLTSDDLGFRDEANAPAHELQRRDELARLKYYARIVMNGQVVSETAVRSIEWPRFALPFHKSVHLWLLRRPQSLAIELWRKRLLLDELVATIMVPVPGQGPDFDHGNTHGIAPKADWYQFAASDVMGPGSLSNRRINGAALVGIEWEATLPFHESTDPPRLPARPRPPSTSRMQGLRTEELAQSLGLEREEGGGRYTRQPLPDFEREKDFLQMLPSLTSIDPNDPRNANLLRFRDMVLPSEALYNRFRTAEHCFQLCFATPQGLLVDYRRFEGPRRHELIRLRRRKPEAFVAPIPLSEAEIRRDEGYKALIQEERQSREDTDLRMDPSDRKAADRGKLRDFVRRVRESRGAIARTKRKRKIPLASLVQEELLPAVQSTFLIDFTQFLPAPRRSLRPAPKVRTPANANVSSCRLLIQVVLARNVPARKFEKKAGDLASGKKPSASGRGGRAGRRRKGSDADEDDGERARGEGDEEDEDRTSKAELTKVQSFVEIRFQDQVLRTKVASGRTPIWKDSISLPFTPPMGDFSTSALSQIRDSVTLALFDLIRIDDRPSGGYYADENTVRTEKRFLGSLTVPFSTVFMEGRVDGVFRLDTPIVNLGYQQVALSDSNEAATSAKAMAAAAQTPMSENLLRESEAASYMSIMATLDPLLLTPIREEADFTDLQEDRAFVKYARIWLERARQLTSFNPRRNLRIFVPKMDGERVFISRFLRAQNPPAGLTTVRQCVRYVSLIPYLEDWQAFVGEGDIWCTSQQLLDILAGDSEEHAVLLYNYLQYLSEAERDKDAEERGRAEVYVVLGHGIPEGKTTYVMSKRRGERGTSDVVLWNPCTGLGYSMHDERCPLQDVGMLVSNRNLYVNLQTAGHVSKLSFDLDNPKNWLPFFTRAFPLPEPGKMPSVQASALTYSPTSKTFVLELEEQMLDSLKRYIRRWRARRATTSFSAEVSSRLGELLPTLERVKQGEANFSAEDHEKKLAPVLRQRDLFGMPLNMCFTEIGDVIQRVKATGIHETQNPDAQFALAVSIFPYPNHVLSVWVYFAMFIPRMNVIK